MSVDARDKAIDHAVDLAMRPASVSTLPEIAKLFEELTSCFDDESAHFVTTYLGMLGEQAVRLKELLRDVSDIVRDHEIRQHLRQTLLKMIDLLSTATASAATALSTGPRPVVISIHGIETRGKWQKDLAPVLAGAGFIPELMDYGRFLTIKLVIPWFRRRQVEWFLREYTRIAAAHPGSALSIVAHSFGTYLVARSMEKYSDHIKYDRIIFCGSIVRCDYPWEEAAKQKRLVHILNEFGHMDFWAWIAAYFVEDAGQAGRKGFSPPRQCLTQREHPEHRHSDYFHSLNYQQTWIPFLQGTPSALLKPLPPATTNRKFKMVFWTIVAAIGLALAALLYWGLF